MGERDGRRDRATAHGDEAQVLPQQQGVPAKPTTSAQANHMLASLLGQRVTPPSKSEHDFGEHIVGSDNNIEHIHAPWNLSDTPATAEFSVNGEAFQLTSLNVMALKPSNRMQGDDLTYAERASPKIAFRPRRVGEFHGTLAIKISWPMDGHVETQTIALRGRARELTQAPAKFGVETAEPDVAVPAVPQPLESSSDRTGDEAATKKDLSRAIQNKHAVDLAIGEAADAAQSLARAQHRGLGIVEKEASTYAKAVPAIKRSKWWDLAEMALNLATGSLAGAFATKLLPRLLSKTETLDIPMLGKIEETITPTLSEKLTGTIKAAIISAGAKAIKVALPPETAQANAPAEEVGPREGKFSSNARIDFFEQQGSVLDVQEKQYKTQVKEQAKSIGPLIVSRPDAAVRALTAVKEEFEGMEHDAIQAQINAVAPAWATLVARLGLGQETTTTAPGPHGSTARQATQMDALRRYDRGDPTASAAGVLDIYVTSGKVVGAKLNGVAQEIADHLAKVPLAQVAMPIRFIMGRPGEPQPTILTRDEAGRVRVQGELKGQTNEHEAVRTASELINGFLSTSLNSIQIEIQTDDSSGRRP